MREETEKNEREGEGEREGEREGPKLPFGRLDARIRRIGGDAFCLIPLPGSETKVGGSPSSNYRVQRLQRARIGFARSSLVLQAGETPTSKAASQEKRNALVVALELQWRRRLARVSRLQRALSFFFFFALRVRRRMVLAEQALRRH